MTDNGPPDAPFRWPVRMGHHIGVSPERLWSIISEPGNLEPCHPFCRANPVSRWPGPDSRDEVHYLSGWIYERRFLTWVEGVGYDLEIGARDAPTSFVSWRIEPADTDRSALTIEIRPHLLQPVPLAIRWVPHFTHVKPMLLKYLSSVLRGVDWYATRGEPVPRNQFGAHPWFSEKPEDRSERN